MMKLLVNDPGRANLALSEAGLASAVRGVVAIAIDDQPGTLFKLADLLDENGINMLDAYGFVVQPQKEAIWCVEIEDTEKVGNLVTSSGFRVLDEAELYES